MQNTPHLASTHQLSNQEHSDLQSRHPSSNTRGQSFSQESLNSKQIANQLHVWLVKQLGLTQLNWINKTIEELSKDNSELVLITRFSVTSRQVGKGELALTTEDLQTAHVLRAGWTPQNWSVDQATRTLFLLSFAKDNAHYYVNVIEKLFSAADVAEQVALYQSLPLLPYPEHFVERAIEGLRSNIISVFNAIALHNPYPADYFAEAAWNQMVLKALFVDSPLSQIQGLDARANAKLAQMLADYAHERWAASRPVNPQLWRLVGPFSQGQLVADLEQVLSHGQPHEQQAAALACASSPTSEAQALLARVPALQTQIATKQLTWRSFSHHHL